MKFSISIDKKFKNVTYYVDEGDAGVIFALAAFMKTKEVNGIKCHANDVAVAQVQEIPQKAMEILPDFVPCEIRSYYKLAHIQAKELREVEMKKVNEDKLKEFNDAKQAKTAH